MLQRQQELQRDIAEKNEHLQALKQQIGANEDILRQLNLAITMSSDASLVRQAGQIQNQPLSGYKLGIYYLQGNKNAETRAKELMAALLAGHYPGAIALSEKPIEFFNFMRRPEADEIRFEPDYETAQAQALITLLFRIDPTHRYALMPVENRTPNFISAFLRNGLE